MKGLPGCGKSTRAEEIAKTSGNAIRLTKDLIREMLHFNIPNKPGYKFKGKQEGEVIDAERFLAKHFLSRNKNVIIDDTNLNPHTMQGWIYWANGLNVKHQVIDMTDVDVMTCIIRDNEREKNGKRFVGGTVIKNMAIQWGLIGFDKDSVVLCDIDGTIADITHRRKYVLGDKKDWKGFYSEMDKDAVRKDISKQIIDLYNQGKTIIYVSGRPDTYRDLTIDWLQKNFMSFGFTIIMRPGNDSREDSIIKKEILDRYFPDKSVIHKVFDDRPRVIRMWKENGLDVVDVGDGVEF